MRLIKWAYRFYIFVVKFKVTYSLGDGHRFSLIRVEWSHGTFSLKRRWKNSGKVDQVWSPAAHQIFLNTIPYPYFSSASIEVKSARFW